MSLISKALKKVENARQGLPNNKPNDIVYLTDAPQSWPRTALMALLIVCTLTAILISMMALTVVRKNAESKQMTTLKLIKIINSQEKKINDLRIEVNKKYKFSDSQLRDMRLGLKNSTKNVNLQISALASNNKEKYNNLKEALISQQQEINDLENYSKNLDQKIESMSVINAQAQDVTKPASGN